MRTQTSPSQRSLFRASAERVDVAVLAGTLGHAQTPSIRRAAAHARARANTWIGRVVQIAIGHAYAGLREIAIRVPAAQPPEARIDIAGKPARVSGTGGVPR